MSDEVALLQLLVAGADHAVDDPALVDGGARFGRDRPAVAEHRDAVADRQHVVEEMRDEHDAAPGLAQPAQQREQPLDLGRRQRRGRLVQDDDARAGEQHARELDQLLQAERQRAHPRARIDVDAEALQMLGRAAAHRPPVDQAEPVDRLHAEMDVLRHRQLAHDGKLLMHHADAGRARIARRAKADRPAVEAHLALILGVHAGDDLHQRGLAGAVLADQPVDLARRQREIARHAARRRRRTPW